MTKAEERVLLALLKRFEWRSGDVPTRLQKIEGRAVLRAKGEAYTDDPDLDRAIVKMAKRLRKAAA